MKLDELEKLANAATPGPWRKTAHGVVCTDTGNGDTDSIVLWDDEPKHIFEDATFIAAANPATIKRLIALCRMQHEALLDCEGAFDECKDYPVTYAGVIEALAAFDELNGE